MGVATGEAAMGEVMAAERGVGTEAAMAAEARAEVTVAEARADVMVVAVAL